MREAIEEINEDVNDDIDEALAINKETNISRSIKALRKGYNLTIKDMASILGISQGAYHNYESGLKTPDIDVIIKLSIYYKLNIEIFIFLYCQDFASSHDVELENVLKIHTYDKIYEPEDIILIEKYKTLSDEYKSAVSTFIDAANICSERALENYNI